MNLDKGFCTVYSTADGSEAGNMPADVLDAVKHQSWYGELNFETTPVYATEKQEDIQISARIRVLQNRQVNNHDIAILSSVLPPPEDSVRFKIIRAYHGVDEESGELITDLTLKEVQQQYDTTGIP